MTDNKIKKELENTELQDNDLENVTGGADENEKEILKENPTTGEQKKRSLGKEFKKHH